MADPTPRERLLDALLAHFEAHGMGDMSLRDMARAVGTSHRMLSYHFGSRHGLLSEIARAVERRQREAFAAMLADPTASPVDVMRQMYERVTDPSLRAPERLFFEVYARALREPGATGFLPEAIDAWLEPVTVLFARLGLTPYEAAAEARLSLAVSRGLLLDLLATEDRAAVDAAAERYLRRFAQTPPPTAAARSSTASAAASSQPPA